MNNLPLTDPIRCRGQTDGDLGARTIRRSCVISIINGEILVVVQWILVMLFNTIAPTNQLRKHIWPDRESIPSKFYKGTRFPDINFCFKFVFVVDRTTTRQTGCDGSVQEKNDYEPHHRSRTKTMTKTRNRSGENPYLQMTSSRRKTFGETVGVHPLLPSISP